MTGAPGDGRSENRHGTQEKATEREAQVASGIDHPGWIRRVVSRLGCLERVALLCSLSLLVGAILDALGWTLAATLITVPLLLLLPVLFVGIWLQVGWAGFRAVRAVAAHRTEKATRESDESRERDRVVEGRTTDASRRAKTRDVDVMPREHVGATHELQSGSDGGSDRGQDA